MIEHTSFEFYGTIRKPLSIVSLVPSFSQSVEYLGLGKHLTGVTDKCDENLHIGRTLVGSFAHADIDIIRSLKPDLVLMLSGINKDLQQDIKEMGAMLLVSRPSSYEVTIDVLQKIVDLSGEQEAREKLAALLKRASNVQDKIKNLPKKRVYRLMQENGLRTATELSFQYDMIKRAGGCPFAIDNPKAPYMDVTLEQFEVFDPQVIITCGAELEKDVREVHKDCQSAIKPCQRTLKYMQENPLWQNCLAAKNNAYYFPSCRYICHPGVNMILGIEKLARYLHPQAFEGFDEYKCVTD